MINQFQMFQSAIGDPDDGEEDYDDEEKLRSKKKKKSNDDEENEAAGDNEGGKWKFTTLALDSELPSIKQARLTLKKGF